MTNYTKIITHAGNFHADEVLSVALLRAIGIRAPLYRQFQVSPEDLTDPTVIVLDMGGEYNPELGSFDHHQDKNLQAINMLVLDYFAASVGVEGIRERLANHWFARVSQVDRGEWSYCPRTMRSHRWNSTTWSGSLTV